MNIGLFQYSPVWEDKEANKKRILELLADQKNNANLLIFPEMTLTGFSMQPDKLAEDLQGESVNFFSELAQKYKCDICAGIIENESGKFYNSLIHITSGGSLKNCYHKIHPFSYSDEDKYYSAGNNIVITEINGWKTGLTICYDLRFPEIYRLYAKEKVSLLIDIANWPDTRIEHWRILLKARAIENQCYVVGVNRVGKDTKLNYNGCSGVYDPMGCELIAVKDKEGVIRTEIDNFKVENTRSTLPFLEDIKLI
jgi:predicted amidohydrolase